MFQDHLIGSRRSSSGKNIVLEHEYLRFDSIVCDKSFIFMESLSQLCNIKWRAGVIVPGLCWNKNANVKVIEETWSTKVRCLLRCAHLKVPWKSGMRAVRWKFCLSLLMSLSLFFPPTTKVLGSWCFEGRLLAIWVWIQILPPKKDFLSQLPSISSWSPSVRSTFHYKSCFVIY